jgi:hypothetical protein
VTTILQFLKFFLPTFESQRDLDEAYLAQAADVQDLERRMRDIDARGRHGLSAAAVGMYAR